MSQFVVARESTYGGSLVSSSTRGVAVLPPDGLEARYRSVPDLGLHPGDSVARKDLRKIPDGGQGDIEVALVSNGIQPLLSAFFGTAAVTTPGGATDARLHSFTGVGEPAGETIYLQKVVSKEDDTDGGIFTFKGVEVTQLDFTQGVGDGDQAFAHLKASVDAKQLVTNVSKATATFRPIGDVFTYENCTVTLDGSVPCANSFSLSLAKNLNLSRRCLDKANPRHRSAKGGATGITGQFTVVHDGNDLFDLWVGNDDVPLVIEWESDLVIESTTKYKLTITIPSVQLAGDTPKWQIGGSGTQDVKLVGVNNGTDQPVTIELVTDDTAL